MSTDARPTNRSRSDRTKIIIAVLIGVVGIVARYWSFFAPSVMPIVGIAVGVSPTIFHVIGIVCLLGAIGWIFNTMVIETPREIKNIRSEIERLRVELSEQTKILDDIRRNTEMRERL